MVTAARVRAEISREVLRPSSLWLAVGVLTFCLTMALFAVSQASLKLYTPAVYLFAPLVMVPVGVHRAARDRHRDAAALNATTPVRPSEAVLGKILGLALVWMVILAATVPLLYVLTGEAATAAFVQLTPLLAWGLVLGLVGLLAGLIVGYVQDGDATRAVAWGCGLVLVSIALALQRGRFYAMASSETQLAIVRGVLHLSPLTWAIEALHPDAAFLRPDHLGLLTGLALFVIPLAMGLASLAVGLQHFDGWRTNLRERRRALIGLAIAGAAVGILLTSWSYPQPASDQPGIGVEAPQAQVGDTQIRFALEDETPWKVQTAARAHVMFHGKPNATHGLDRFALEAEHLRLEPRSAVPSRVSLDEAGRGHVEIPLTLTPQRLVAQTTARTNLTLDGESASLATVLSPAGVALPMGASVLTGLASLGTAATAAIIVPRRMNRW